MLRIGLIGLGRHGSRYARHLLQSDPPVPARLVAVSRRQHDAGLAFARSHGLRFHQDFRALIADREVDAVVVVTPPGMTKAACLEAVGARKPLLIEKPLAVSASDAETMVTAAETAQVPLMTAHTLRFDSVVQDLRARLPQAGAGRYLALASRIEPREDLWRSREDYGGRGVLLEIGIHLLDLVRFLTGDEVEEVRCEMDVVGRPESRAWAWLRLRSGLPVLLDVSRVAAGRVSRAEWIGERGQLIADWTQHRLSWVDEAGRSEQDLAHTPTVVETLRRFAEAVSGGQPMPISGRDGLQAVAIADACYASAAGGWPVRVPWYAPRKG